MVTKQPYYFGKLDEDEVTKRLQGTRSGTYLLKDSTTTRGGYTLCVNESGSVNDYPITRRGGRYTVEDREFVDLTALIDFYKTHMLDTTTLTQIASRDGLPSPKTPTSPSAANNFRY